MRESAKVDTPYSTSRHVSTQNVCVEVSMAIAALDCAAGVRRTLKPVVNDAAISWKGIAE